MIACWHVPVSRHAGACDNSRSAVGTRAHLRIGRPLRYLTRLCAPTEKCKTTMGGFVNPDSPVGAKGALIHCRWQSCAHLRWANCAIPLSKHWRVCKIPSVPKGLRAHLHVGRPLRSFANIVRPCGGWLTPFCVAVNFDGHANSKAK